MRIVVIDNYDSFTYNLVHILNELTGKTIDIFRNDEISPDEIVNYDKILISPGPGVPDQAGITKEVIRLYGPSKSILGICLGCQAIAEVYGGSLINLANVFHGMDTDIIVTCDDEEIFQGIPRSFKGGRYHSWVVNEHGLPSDLIITARDKDGSIMAISHKTFNVKGVQFHPESIMTFYGKQIISNWLKT